tara:strand:- start:480 stop:1226 length:747 start_codon:yes stop_codon:yes gene_type:complete
MGNIVQYNEWSAEAAAQELAQATRQTNNSEIMRLKVGRNVVRFLPMAEGMPSPFQVVWQHFIQTDDKPIVFPCPWRMEQKRCPICDEGNRLSRTGNPVDKESARKMWPSMRVFANAIDKNDIEAGPKVVAMPRTVYEELISIRTDADAGGDFTHPETGFDIIIERTGTGLSTRYRVSTARSNSQLENMDWIGAQHDLSRFAVMPTRDMMENAMAALTGTMMPTIDVAPAAISAPRRARKTAADDLYDE